MTILVASASRGHLTNVFLGAFAKSRKATISFVMSFRPSSLNNLAPTGWIFTKFDSLMFFENLSRKFNFHENRTGIKDTLHEDQYTFSIKCRSGLLRMKNVSDKRRRENQNTHFMPNNFLSNIVPFMR